MAMNRIQFQAGLSMSAFFERYGTGSLCAAALERARWPDGFRCPCCGGAAHCLLRGGARKVFQCNACRHQTSLIAGTVLQGTKLPLTVWFLALYLLSQAKTGLSALALKRHLGVSYPTAWLIHHKVMQAMAERDARYVLAGQVQVDDAYLGGERSGGKAGRGSENKIPFVATVSLSDDGHPLRAKLSPVPAFTLTSLRAAPCARMAWPASVPSPRWAAPISRPSWRGASHGTCRSSSGSGRPRPWRRRQSRGTARRATSSLPPATARRGGASAFAA